jgi:P-aminobenzoate N-oxygenase AurF
VNIYKVLPSLTNDRQLNLWHKALRSQWSAMDLDWQAPGAVRGGRLRDQLARVLTPVLMGEQAALYSVSSLIPLLGHRSEVEGQFYLTTWAVDEARHTELFARYYGRLDREPESIRRFPSGYLFQSRITSKDPAEWLAGVLVSEVLATLVMKELRRIDLDPVLTDIATGILRDEARHLAFNHVYTEDEVTRRYLAGAAGGDARAAHLRGRIESVLAGVPPILDEIDAELAAVGIDRERLFAELAEDARRRLETSITRGRKVAAGEAEASRVDEAAAVEGEPVTAERP